MKTKRSPIALPGTRDKRVFIFGNIGSFGARLNDIGNAVTACGLTPIYGNALITKTNERLVSKDIINKCKYAIIEISIPDGLFFQLDCIKDSPVMCLCVWDNTYTKTMSGAILTHPVYVTNRSYSDGDLLKTSIYSFIGYNPEITRKQGAVQLYVDDIDSFSKVKQIENHLVKDFDPFSLSEKQIKANFAEIIGEDFIPKDWGGENYDLSTNYIKYENKRIQTGFMFKGPGLGRKVLTISRLGKNGNQIVKLTRITHDFYVVQFVGAIDNDVIDHLDAQVERIGHQKNKLVWYCVINGTDTARLFRAYGKI
jgi:hypothetical protein